MQHQRIKASVLLHSLYIFDCTYMTFYFFSKKCIPSDLWLIKCCLAYLDFNTTYLHGLGKKKTKTRTSMNKKNVKEKSQENNIPCILR